MAPERKSTRKSKKPSMSVSPQQSVSSIGGKPVFPVDFFEHCGQLQDIEFEGNDLLEVYHREQLKTRLLGNSMHVVCTKSTGFKLDIINNDSSAVITGEFLLSSARWSPIFLLSGNVDGPRLLVLPRSSITRQMLSCGIFLKFIQASGLRLDLKTCSEYLRTLKSSDGQ